MRLEGGPFIILDFLLDNNKKNIDTFLLNLENIGSELSILDLENIDNKLSVFDIEGKKFIKQGLESGFLGIYGKLKSSLKPFNLYIHTLSNELILFDFSFIYYTGINGKVFGFRDDDIEKDLIPFLEKLCKILHFDFGMISKEFELEILDYFDVSECYPHDDYKMDNFNLKRFFTNDEIQSVYFKKGNYNYGKSEEKNYKIFNFFKK